MMNGESSTNSEMEGKVTGEPSMYTMPASAGPAPAVRASNTSSTRTPRLWISARRLTNSGPRPRSASTLVAIQLLQVGDEHPLLQLLAHGRALDLPVLAHEVAPRLVPGEDHPVLPDASALH